MVGDLEFVPGHEWSYEARGVDHSSTLIVGGIEHDKKMRTIVHIAIKNVRVSNPHSDNGVATHFGHIPISEAALRRSILKLVSEGADTEGVEEGIRPWRKKNGGAFAVSVARAVQYVQDALIGGDGSQ